MKTGTFKKYCPNVWVAFMHEECEKGEVIQVENRFGINSIFEAGKVLKFS